MNEWWASDPVASGTPAAAQGWWSSDPIAEKPPAFGSDEYVKNLAEKHGADPDYVSRLTKSIGSTEFLKGAPIAGALIDKAGAGLAAMAHGATGAGAPGASLGERYGKNLALLQDLAGDFEREHPYVSTAAQTLGGVATTAATGGTTLGAKLLGMTGNLGQRVGWGAVGGGLINAADAALRDQNDPLTAAGIGGAVGAGLGGGVPLVGQAVSTLARPLMATIRGAANPQAQAARNVATAIDRDVQAGAAGMTQPEFAAARAAGQPVNMMDLGGETTRALARSAANTSPEGRQILTQALDQRFESQSQRLGDWFNSTLNYPTEQTRNRAIRDIAENVYQPRYAQAYRDSANKPLWADPDLMRGQPPGFRAAMQNLTDLAQAPAIQNAIPIANAQLRNWAVADGLRPPPGAFTIDRSGGAPRTVLTQTASGNLNMPSLQYWDYIKRALDRMGTPEAALFSRSLRDSLDALVPSYQAARAAAQPTKFFEGAANAHEAGQNFFSRGERFGPQAQTQIMRMTPEERGLFQDGYSTAIIEKIERSPDRRNIVNNIANSQAARREIATALGPARTNELQARLHVEDVMDAGRRAVQGNSTTTRQLFELGLAGGVGLLEGGNPTNWDPATIMHAALMYGAARGQGAINSRVARQVAEMLASRDINRLNTGMRMVAGNPQMRNALRLAGGSLARSTAVQMTPMALPQSAQSNPSFDPTSIGAQH
jgi:hypothetical protein